jgi:hypothetical protein
MTVIFVRNVITGLRKSVETPIVVIVQTDQKNHYHLNNASSTNGGFKLRKSGGSMNQPNVSEIIDRLKSVLNRNLTREEVSDWASF